MIFHRLLFPFTSPQQDGHFQNDCMRNQKTRKPVVSGIMHPNPRRSLLAVGVILILWVLMTFHFLPDRISLRPGERSHQEVRASRSVTYIDHEMTEQLQSEAALQVPHFYDVDTSAAPLAVHTVQDIFDRIRQVRKDNAKSTIEYRMRLLTGSMGSVLPSHLLRYLLTSPDDNLARLQTSEIRLVDDEMNKEIRNDTDDLVNARAELRKAAGKVAANQNEVDILSNIADQALRPSLLYNRRKTELLREAAMRSVMPVTGQIHPGDIIIRDGDIVSRKQLDECTALGLISPHISIVVALSLGILASIMTLLTGYYVRYFYRPLYDNLHQLILLALTVILSVFGLKVFSSMLGIPFSGLQTGYMGMMTVAGAGMLISVLMNPQIAVLVTGILSVQSGLMLQPDIRFPLITFFSSLCGIYCVSHIQHRIQLLRAMMIMTVFNLLLVWMLGGLLGDTLREIQVGSAWAVASAAFTIAIFWLGVALLEKPFNILTHIWLLELSSSDQPLLRELCLAAPSTYAHSIMVGNLAEAAAEAIGADSLFCRVASYYHDIGKIRRPHCYVENQRSDNIHDRLNPSLSALIISSHVREGLELAKQHRLPVQIQAVISEHHGTCLIRYFYHQAILSVPADSTHDSVLEQHFRYDGPRPQTRESGIIMLADSVEAAARCLDKPSLSRLEGLTEMIIQDKLQDGQLDECDLTFKDIHNIQAAFVRILSAMLHGRIDYPALPGTHHSNEHTMAASAITYGHSYSEQTSAGGSHKENKTGSENHLAS
jgi:putative nucleotidyltransferase with HDIG domain